MKIFSDLSKAAVNPSVISDKNTDGKWTALSYKTALCEGTMLMTPQASYPEPIEIKINLEGMYRIYIGVLHLNPDNYFHIKLSDEVSFSGVKPTWYGSPTRWHLCEYAEEVYWKSADLTNQNIIIEKPHAAKANVPAILWIRCEEMTEEEISRYNEQKTKCVQAHIDIDPFYELKFNTAEDTLVKLYPLKNTNVEFCSVETWAWNDAICDGAVPTNALSDRTWQGFKFDRKELYSLWRNFAHESGFKLYSATRMSLGDFNTAMSPSYFNKNFVAEHSELYCKNRDGSSPKVCSYAFEETQNYMINEIADNACGYFDGVTLIFTRGIHIAFEKPVIDRFNDLYPGVNPILLPASDKRLHGVWCEFMTAFMQKLRAKLGDDIKINVLTDYGLESAKNFGIDIERWAKLGLIDSVAQCNMEMFEELDDCMDGEFIDLDKYKAKILEKPVLCRNFCTDPEKVCAHMPEYLEIEEKYGVKVYHTLPWENTTPLGEYKAVIKKMQKSGAKRFMSWDMNHTEYTLPEFHAITGISNSANDNVTLSKFYRMLSIDENDMTYALSAWKG